MMLALTASITLHSGHLARIALRHLVGAFYQQVASFFSFFFVRPENVCVVDTFYRTTKSTEPASGITAELL